jgi:hypothetical protein
VILFGVGRYRGLLGGRAPLETPGACVELDFVPAASHPGSSRSAGMFVAAPAAVSVVTAGRVTAVARVFYGRFWAIARAERDDVRVLPLAR